MPEEILTADKREAILKAGEAVYSGYLLLDMLTNTYYADRNPAFQINGKCQTFRDYLASLLKGVAADTEKVTQAMVFNDGKHYCLSLNRLPDSPKEWRVVIMPSEGGADAPVKSSIQEPIKPGSWEIKHAKSLWQRLLKPLAFLGNLDKDNLILSLMCIFSIALLGCGGLFLGLSVLTFWACVGLLLGGAFLALLTVSAYFNTEQTQTANTISEDKLIKRGAIKPLNHYTADDLLSLINAHPLSIAQADTGEYKFSTEIQVKDKDVVIGGRDKIELYQLHINNLYAILQQLADDRLTHNMLIAMATGSGKSFTQALWFLILYLSNINAVFAVPSDRLAEQLKRDFGRLLSRTIVDFIRLHHISQPDADPGAPFWTITTHRHLLGNMWNELIDDNPKTQNLFLCFDEEHEATREELLNKRIAYLVKIRHHPMMFLSATPSKKAYGYCGNRSVASLSRKEKEELGIAVPPVAHVIEAQPPTQKAEFKVENFLQRAWNNLYYKLPKKFADALEEEKTSPVLDYLDSSETMVHYRKSTDPYFVAPQNNYGNADNSELRRFMRWNIQSAIGEKALVLVDEHDSVINFSLATCSTELVRQYPYKQGNRSARNNIYSFFQLGHNRDLDYFDAHAKAKKALRRSCFVNYIHEKYPGLSIYQIEMKVKAQVDFAESKDFLSYRVFHGMVENLLSFLTGYDSPRLDHERFHNLSGLVDKVKQAINQYSHWNNNRLIASITEHLRKDNSIPEAIAGEFAEAMVEILDKASGNPSLLELLVDNWSLDKKLHEDFLRSESKVKHIANKYKHIFLINGLEKTETGIESDKPFFGLIEGSYRLSDKDKHKEEAKKAKKRKLSTLETLDDTSVQYTYKPQYIEDLAENEKIACSDAERVLQRSQREESAAKVNEKEATKKARIDAEERAARQKVTDDLFRKGLIGAYVTSEKVVGFNDLNLQHVAMLIDSSDDKINAPDQIIQGSGRNRCLNPARQPFFFISTERSVRESFAPADLEQSNYFPTLFSKREEHHRKVVNILGAKLAKQIREWLATEMDPNGEIEVAIMQRKCREMLLDEFERIYNESDHDFEKAKAKFALVLEDLYTELYSQSHALTEAYSLDISARIIGIILEGITSLYYNLFAAFSYILFLWRSSRLAENDPLLLPEITYAHIIQNYKYEDFLAIGVAGKRFRDILEEQFTRTANALFKKGYTRFFKPDSKQLLLNLFKQVLAPQLVKLIGNAKQQAILLDMIACRSNWLELAEPYDKQLLEGTDAEKINAFMQIIQQEPDIKEYLNKHGLQAEPERIDRLNQLQANAENDIKRKAEEVMLETTTQFIKEHLQQIAYSLESRDALFLLQYKDTLNFNQDDLKQLQELVDLKGQDEMLMPYRIYEILAKALPEDVRKEGQSQGLLKANPYGLDYFFEKIIPLIKLIGTPAQQVELLDLMKKRSDWLRLAMPYRECLMNGEIKDKVAAFVELIQQDSAIKNYLNKDPKILNDISPINTTKRIAAITEFFNNIVSEITKFSESISLFSKSSVMLTSMVTFQNPKVKVINQFIINHLDKFTFFLHPHDVAFILEHVNELHFNEEHIQRFEVLLQGHSEIVQAPYMIFNNLTQGLPAEILVQAKKQGLLDENRYNGGDEIKTLVQQRLIKHFGTYQQQARLIEMLEHNPQWIELALRKKEVLLHADTQAAVAALSEVFETVPAIKAYLENEKELKVDVASEEAFKAFAASAAKELTNKIEVAAFKKYIMDNLENILMILDPYDAAFILKHSKYLVFDDSILEKVQAIQAVDHKELARLTLDMFYKALPRQYQKQAQKAGLLAQERYDRYDRIQQSVNDMGKEVNKHIDIGLVQNVFAQATDYLIQAPIYRQVIDNIIGPLEDKHLLTILNALYPEQESNKKNDFINSQKLALIRDYRLDLDRLTPEALYKKYLNMADLNESDFKLTQTYQIHQWLYDIYEEILHNICYYHNMSDKGEFEASEKSKLLAISHSQNKPSGEIWSCRVSAPRATLTAIATKTKFISSSIDSFSSLNEVEALGEKHTIAGMQTVAEHIIKPFYTMIRDGDERAINTDSDPKRRDLLKATIQFGCLFNRERSFTQGEVESPETKDLNAVQRLRRQALAR